MGAEKVHGIYEEQKPITDYDEPGIPKWIMRNHAGDRKLWFRKEAASGQSGDCYIYFDRSDGYEHWVCCDEEGKNIYWHPGKKSGDVNFPPLEEWWRAIPGEGAILNLVEEVEA